MSRIIKLNSNSKETKLKLIKIKDIDESISMGSWEKKIPYELTFKSSEYNIEFVCKSTAILKPKSWAGKFYLKSDSDQIRFSKEHELLALYKILLAKGIISSDEKEVDIDKFINKEFDGAFIETENACFIDWCTTLQMNGVELPSAESLKKPSTFGSELDDNDDMSLPD